MKKRSTNCPEKLSNFISPTKAITRSGIAAIALFLFLMPFVTVGQDPQFSQFFANPLYLNPANAGLSKCPHMTMNYRNEWPALSGTFVTSSVGYDVHSPNLQGGIGILILSDRAGGGTLNTTSASLLYSYFAAISRKWSVRAGFQAGYIQKKVDWDKLTFGDMIDPRYGFIYKTAETEIVDTKGNLDLSSGILVYSKKYFAGFAVHHLTQPAEGFIEEDKARLPMKFTLHAGALFIIKEHGEDLKVSPNIIFQRQQDFRHLTLGGYLNKGPLYGGLWYRHAEKNSDSFILLTGLQMGIIKMGYSYDITLSKLSSASGGSHELSFSIQFECRPTPRKPLDDCPIW